MGDQAIRLGVVGLGQCGGNLAAEFAARGYPAIAVNTSPTDLDAIDGLPEDRRLRLGEAGSSGTGGSLERGIQAVDRGADRIQEAITELMPHVDAILAIGGLGGGTGGALGELVDQLTTRGNGVIAAAVLPTASDSLAVKVNALKGLNAVLDSNFESLLLVDNQKLNAAFADAAIGRFFAAGNAAVAHLVDTLNALPSKPELASIRTFDPADFRQVVLSGGVTVLGRQELGDTLDAQGLMAALGRALNDNPLLATGFDLEDVVELGSVVAAPRALLDDTPATVFDAFLAEVKQTTRGAAHHVGIYQQQDGPPTLYVVAGGLPLPTRAEALLAEATDEAERFAAKKRARRRPEKLDLSGLGIGAAPRAGDAAKLTGKGMAKAVGLDDGTAVMEEIAGDLDFGDDMEPVDVDEGTFHD